MLRLRRLLAALVAVLLAAGLLVGSASTSAVAAARPVVSSVAPVAGPLKPTVITIKGKNLKGATAVRFGKKSGKIVKVVDATTLQVRTPKGVKAGKVAVTVRTRAGWSKKSSSSRYTFVKAPKLSKLSATKGTFAGGQRVTLTGKDLKATEKVLFADLAATIVSKRSRKLVVTTPPGVLGKVAVRVVSAGGTSKSRSYLYVTPASRASSTLVAADRTVVPPRIEWVTGGPTQSGVADQPWVVGLPSGSDVPSIGDHLLVKPGNDVFPSGLAGTVGDVAVQADESVRVSVAPTDLGATVSRLQADFDGRVRFPVGSGGRTSGRRLDGEVSEGTSFSFKGASPFACSDKQGRPVAVGADLSLSVQDVDVSQHLDLGGVVRKPSYDGAFSSEVRTVGKVTVASAATCKLKPAWQNLHRTKPPILLGGGATLTFGPTLEFKVSAKGTFKVTDRTRTTFAISAEYGHAPTFTRTSRNLEHKPGGSLSFSAEVTAGVSVQVALFDRAGIEGKVVLGVSESVTADNTNVCVEGKLFVRLSVGMFFDLWVARWESARLTATLDLARIHACVLPEQGAPSSEPDITSARMPDATIDEPYDATLTTADNRAGSWSLVSALPSGLSLDGSSGHIGGKPTGPVGDVPVVVDFTDADGKVATTTIRIMVLPSTGLGGGNIQVTLTWTGGADLDLHVFDPAGEEIWYRNRESASGGVLDHDANAGCQDTGDGDHPVENVYWPPNEAPAGTYSAAVRVYRECSSPLDWHLVVRRNGAVVVDQTGTGDSPAFTFGVGQGAGARIAQKAVTTSSAPK